MEMIASFCHAANHGSGWRRAERSGSWVVAGGCSFQACRESCQPSSQAALLGYRIYTWGPIRDLGRADHSTDPGADDQENLRPYSHLLKLCSAVSF